MESFVGEEGLRLEPSPLEELLTGGDAALSFDFLDELGLGAGDWDPAPAVSGCNENDVSTRPAEAVSQQAAESLKRPAAEVAGSSESDDAELKRQRKLEKNRQAAALSRNRKKDLISSLQQRVALLEQANFSMGHALAVLQAENQHLRGLVKGADDQTGTAVSHAAPRLTAYRHAAPRCQMLARSSLLPLLWCLFASLSRGSGSLPLSGAPSSSALPVLRRLLRLRPASAALKARTGAAAPSQSRTALLRCRAGPGFGGGVGAHAGRQQRSRSARREFLRRIAKGGSRMLKERLWL